MTVSNVDATTTKQKCAATNARGEPCNAYAGAGSEFCFWHDPARAADRARARSKGGKARHGRHLATDDGADPVQVQDVSDILALLARALNDVLALENSIQRGRAVGYLCGQALKVLEVSELNGRLEALETIIKLDWRSNGEHENVTQKLCSTNGR